MQSMNPPPSYDEEGWHMTVIDHSPEFIRWAIVKFGVNAYVLYDEDVFWWPPSFRRRQSVSQFQA